MAAPSCSTQTLTGKSYFRPTVTLYDWWLVKYETDDQGKRVAVAGISSAGHGARRVFASAPISKVHDVFTLETTDGYWINLKGFINMEQTTENGFPDEISKSFLFGFPELWETRVAEFLGGDSNLACSGKKQSSPTFVDNDQEETPHEQVVWEDRHNVGLPKQKASSNITFHELNTDDTVHHAAEEDTSKEKIKSTYFSCIGPRKSLKDKLKNPVSRCSVTHTNNNFIASSLGGVSGAAAQSWKKMEKFSKGKSGLCVDHSSLVLEREARKCGGDIDISKNSRTSADRVPGNLSIIAGSKQKKHQNVSKGLKSENNTMDSAQAFCETVRNTDDCEVGGRGVQRSNSTSVHFNSNSTIDDSKVDDLVNHAAEEEMFTENIGSTEVQCIGSSKTLDVIEKKPGSGYLMKHKITKFSPASGAIESLDVISDATAVHFNSNSTIDDSKMDGLVNHAAEEEMFTENFGSTEVQYIGSSKTLDVIEKNPGSGYLMKHKITKFSPASGAIESLDVISDATAQSSGKMGVSEKSLSDFAGRVSQLFAGINRRKGKKTVGDGLNSERKTMDSVPAVSKRGISILQNESCEVGRNKMPCSSDSEFQEPTSVNVIRRLEFEFDLVEDDLQQTSNAKEEHDRENVTAQVGEGENASRKRNKKKIAADTQETHLTTDVNQKRRASARLLKVNKEMKASPSPSNMNQKTKSFSSNLEGNKRKNATPSIQVVHKKRKRSLSTNRENQSTNCTPCRSKISIVSPESLGFRRSRSGRLQLPPMEFWRNQSPIYDADHGVIGIQEELPIRTPSRGSTSRPRPQIRKACRG